MTEESKRFRKLFVVEPSHDVSILGKYSAQVVFLTSSEDKVEELSEKIRENLYEFDPNRDAIIPMGRVSSCMMTGMFIGRFIEELHKTFPESINYRPVVTMGIYKGDSYIFIPVEIK